MVLSSDDLSFLKEMTIATIDASRVAPGASVGSGNINQTGGTLIRPGGRNCYPAFWARDFSLGLDSGFIHPSEMLHALRVIGLTQNGNSPRHGPRGSVIPPFAVADHVTFAGEAVFYPGAMSAADAGGEPFGIEPPACDHFEFIKIAHHLWQTTSDAAFLSEAINGMTAFQRLKKAFDVPRVDAATGGMVTVSAENRAVGFGFYDIVYLTGSILFASLLRYRAARQMAEMCETLEPESAQHYFGVARDIAEHIPRIFSARESGWLLAATEVGRQPDVWGTLYALHLKILPDDVAHFAAATIADAVRAGTICFEAGVRHIPTDHNASATSAWQRVAPGFPINTYQNGGYWHTPTGWLIEAMNPSNPALAEKIAGDFVAHLRKEDFRRGESFGAPWECFGRDGKGRQNPVYMASIAVPYAVIRDMAKSRSDASSSQSAETE